MKEEKSGYSCEVPYRLAVLLGNYIRPADVRQVGNGKGVIAPHHVTRVPHLKPIRKGRDGVCLWQSRDGGMRGFFPNFGWAVLRTMRHSMVIVEWEVVVERRSLQIIVCH